MKQNWFDEYQHAAKQTAIYPQDLALPYLALGLAGEAGEVANKIKKIIRDHNGEISDIQRQDIISELGDAQWYLIMLCTELGVPASEMAGNNLEKLADRQKRAALGGAGDTR